jgi:hypothetical protein
MTVVVSPTRPADLPAGGAYAPSLDPLPCCRGEAEAVSLDGHLSALPAAAVPAAVRTAAALLRPGGRLSVSDVDLHRFAAAVCDGADPARANGWLAGRAHLPDLAAAAAAAEAAGLRVTLQAFHGVHFHLTAEAPR